MQLYLFEVDAAVDDLGTVRTFRFAYGGSYKQVSAPGYYDGRISTPVNISRGIGSNLGTLDGGQVAAGIVTIDNADGACDALLDHGYGRLARVLMVDSDAPYSSATVLTRGIVERAVGTDKEVTFHFRDLMQELRKPVSPAKFAGTNVGATGIEGLPGDIGGKPKPRTFGKVLNIKPVLLNAAQLIYGWNFDRSGNPLPTATVAQVRDGGIPLTFGADRANLAALQAASPAAGQYDTCIALSIIKLGGLPEFDVTMDVSEHATNNRVAGIIERMLLDAGIASGDLLSSSFTAFDADAPYQVGIYLNEERDTFEAINDIVNSAGGFLAAGPDGKYEIGQFKEPSATADVTFRESGITTKLAIDDADILAIQRVPPSDGGRGVPAQRVNLGYARNFTVQNSLANSVPAEAAVYYKAQQLQKVAEDTGVLLKYPLAPQLDFETLLTEAAEAQAEADRRLGLYGVPRAMYTITAQLTPAFAQTIRNGATVEIFSHRFGLSAGKRFVVTRVELNARIGRANVTVWG